MNEIREKRKQVFELVMYDRSIDSMFPTLLRRITSIDLFPINYVVNNKEELKIIIKMVMLNYKLGDFEYCNNSGCFNIIESEYI